MENITKHNCLELLHKYESLGNSERESAWMVVFKFCMQNGLKDEPNTGIEMVIEFIETNLESK
jgi:hypothetical protein